MTLSEIVSIGAFIGILLTNVFIIILFVNAIQTVVKFKNQVKDFFSGDQMKEIIKTVGAGRNSKEIFEFDMPPHPVK